MRGDDQNIIDLPVQRRDDSPDLFLVPPPVGGCAHIRTGFTVDAKAGKCFCRGCGGEVSPMFVLEQLMKEESRWRRSLEEYKDSMRRLGERSRTKCEHCKKMTRISR